jgi:hypothetical protein
MRLWIQGLFRSCDERFCLLVLVRPGPPTSRLAPFVGEGAQCAKTSNTQILLDPTPFTSATFNMPPASREIETRIANACEAMDNDPKLKGMAAAARFGAPYDRLMACQRGRPPSHTRGGHNKKLLVPQDDSLKDYILMLYHSGHSANLEAIQIAASRLVFLRD